MNKSVTNLDYLTYKHKDVLHNLLKRNKEMFDGALTKYIGSDYTMELNKDVKLYHVKSFHIPQIYQTLLKKKLKDKHTYEY